MSNQEKIRPMSDHQWENVRRIHELTSKRHPLMSECHLRKMDNDVLLRALPPGPYSDRRHTEPTQRC